VKGEEKVAPTGSVSVNIRRSKWNWKGKLVTASLKLPRVGIRFAGWLWDELKPLSIQTGSQPPHYMTWSEVITRGTVQ